MVGLPHTTCGAGAAAAAASHPGRDRGPSRARQTPPEPTVHAAQSPLLARAHVRPAPCHPSQHRAHLGPRGLQLLVLGERTLRRQLARVAVVQDRHAVSLGHQRPSCGHARIAGWLSGTSAPRAPPRPSPRGSPYHETSMAARAPPPPARLTEVEADKGVAPALAVHDQALHRDGHADYRRAAHVRPELARRSGRQRGGELRAGRHRRSRGSHWPLVADTQGRSPHGQR